MRLIYRRKWGDNPTPFYTRINWVATLVVIVIVASVINVLV